MKRPWSTVCFNPVRGSRVVVLLYLAFSGGDGTELNGSDNLARPFNWAGSYRMMNLFKLFKSNHISLDT